MPQPSVSGDIACLYNWLSSAEPGEPIPEKLLMKVCPNLGRPTFRRLRERLGDLLEHGCNLATILEFAYKLARWSKNRTERPKFIPALSLSVEERRKILKAVRGLSHLTRAAEIARTLLREPCFHPERVSRNWDREMVSEWHETALGPTTFHRNIVRDIPDALEDYRQGIEIFLKSFQAEVRRPLIPDLYIRGIGNAIYRATDSHDWKTVAELVEAFGGEISADSLRVRFERARRARSSFQQRHTNTASISSRPKTPK